MPVAVTYVLAYAASTAGITLGALSSTVLLAAGWVVVGGAVPAFGSSTIRRVQRQRELA